MSRYSDHDVDEAVLSAQIQRHRERAVDPGWKIVPASDGFPGTVWRYCPKRPHETWCNEPLGAPCTCSMDDVR